MPRKPKTCCDMMAAQLAVTSSDARRRVAAAEDAIASVTFISDMKVENARTQEYGDAKRQVAALEQRLNERRELLQQRWKREGSI